MKKFAPAPIAIGLVTVLAVGVGAVLLYPPATRAAAPNKTTPTPAMTVTITSARQASLPIALEANGNVAAWQEAIISSESNGLRLTDVRVNIGDVVKAGQVLALFSPDAVNADVAQASANLMEAKANAADAVANAARARTVASTGALSAQQISQYTTAEMTAKARIASAQAALDTQRLRLKYTQVVAPDSGVISARAATVGAVVGTGTELFRMIRQGRLEWRAEVTAAELPQLKIGQQAMVTTAGGASVPGTLRMVGPTVDPQSRYGLVYVDLAAVGTDGKPSPFKAGMFASGRFALGASAAMTLPQPAVVVRDGFSYVFTLNNDGRVSQRKVQTGRRIADRLEIVSGIAAGAQVVVSGAGFLNDGDLVRVATAAAMAPVQ